MSRSLESTFAGGLAENVIMPIKLAMLTFKTATKYCWTGPGPLTWNGQTFLGIGSMGQVGAIQESADLTAQNVSVTLSGIDPVLLAECLTDIQIGAPARIWMGLWKAGGLFGTPYQIFRGQVDKPAVQVGVKELAVSLSLESRIVNLQRAQNARYTATDQHRRYPNDTGFNWVEQLNDDALRWGG